MKIKVDGKDIEYVENPKPLSDVADIGIGHPKMYTTVKEAVPVGTANGRRV